MRVTAILVASALLVSGCESTRSGKKVTVTGSVQSTPDASGVSAPLGGTVLVTGISTPASLKQDIQPGQSFSFTLLKATYIFSVQGPTIPCAPVTVNIKDNQPPIVITCKAS
jgi:hypothetical protein